MFKRFAPLVKVLRMVDADWKPSMGFIYGKIKKAKQEIMDALNNNEKAYAPILDIISRKASGRLDTTLHISAYVLNPYYLYNNLEVQKDDDLNDVIVELADTLFREDYNMQNQITLRAYAKVVEHFGKHLKEKHMTLARFREKLVTPPKSGSSGMVCIGCRKIGMDYPKSLFVAVVIEKQKGGFLLDVSHTNFMYTQLLAESYNEVEFYRQSVFPPTELPPVHRITLL
ncbi:hypothetical protein Tco_0990434 [Tanacetum coccineum]|uniref:Uncharacterized protein n=1 Tax=Tanacetum coccineum TaxID=301880 RepID=A0ABQ5EXL4_9ASTR